MSRRISVPGRAYPIHPVEARDQPEEEEVQEETRLHTKIRQRAYEIFERRGRHPGDPLEDWLQAEREVIDEMENQAWSP